MKRTTVGVSIKVGLILVLAFVLTSCDWVLEPKNSILIIAVDSLGFEKINCEEEKEKPKSGFHYFCNESVKFTHAFTTSTLNQPALTSILTARYPIEHGVHNNGSDFLKSKEKTVAEIAVKKGYKTSLFSGGAPIWRKSGLSQGVEYFSDYFRISKNNIFRNSKIIFNSFFKWLDGDARYKPFVSVLYLPDLQHYREPQISDLESDDKNKIEDTYLNEISRGLYRLRERLIRRKLWKSTTIILTGLRGDTINLKSYNLNTTNLHGRGVQVSLFIKPIQKRIKPTAIDWKVDKNVSLVDIGATVFDLLDEPIKSNQAVSLREVLLGGGAKWSEDRLIFFESSWSDWRKQSDLLAGLRTGHYHIFLNPIKIFNVLTDREELHPIKKTDPLWGSLNKTVMSSIYKDQVTSFYSEPSVLIQKIKLAQRLWSKKYLLEESISELKDFPYQDIQIINWQSKIALETRDWHWLKKLGEIANEPLWIYVAQKNLGLDTNVNLKKGCARYFFIKKDLYKSPNYKKCNNPILIKAMDWVYAKNINLRYKKKDKFLREYRVEVLKNKIQKSNYIQELTWDVEYMSFGKPSLSELFLHLPKNKNYLKTVKNEL